jgi:selenocysteine lyase/cysteine desulfurase
MELAGRISLTRIRANSSGFVEPDEVRRAITTKTKLIALTHASNVIGTIQPIGNVGRIARQHNLLFLVDAAQTAGVVPIDIREMNIDLLAFPGHKCLLGPTGTGALYVGSRTTLRPWREGGTGGDSSSETQPREYPYFLEGGTPNVLGVAGLAAGVKYVQETGIDNIRRHETELVERLRSRLSEIGGYEIFATANLDQRVGTLSFRSDVLPATEIGAILDQSFEIAVRPGLHCAPYIHRSLGTFPDGTVRVSPGPFSTKDDIDCLSRALVEIAG